MLLTDALRGEHAVLYELFDDVRDTAASCDDLQDLRGAVRVLERLLLSHARVEEDLLFPHLETRMGRDGPLAVMRAEHQEIDGLLSAARAEASCAALKVTIGQLLQLAQEHFMKEEGVLFAMAQQFLGTEKQTALGDEWAARRNVDIVGQGCHRGHA